MSKILEGIEPINVFSWFETICQIPHGSFNEKGLSDYLAEAARARGYDVRQDESWNLAIEVPASSGYEDHKKVILQAHLDMVCKKADGCNFDFEKDPLDIYVDGDYIKARNTTLGADNGIGLAMILALMDSKSDPHPPLQLLFTTSEEVACTGAGKMDSGWPDGDYLINLDVFHDDVLLVSCAGISINELRLPLTRVPLLNPQDKEAFTVSFSDMKGGHSGETIHEGRANAIEVLGSMLAQLRETLPFEILSLNADGLFNVICTSSSVTLCTKHADSAKLLAALRTYGDNIKETYFRTDPDMRVSISKVAMKNETTALAPDTANELITLLDTIPAGMKTVFDCPCTLAGSSSNLGSLKEENGEVTLVMSIRSNLEFLHDELMRKYRNICRATGAKLTVKRRIGSWEYRKDSPLRELVCDIYRQQNGEAPATIAIHAGIEIATFIAKLAEHGRSVDAVAFGPTTLNAHSPEETVQISSVAKIYRLLSATLESL